MAVVVKGNALRGIQRLIQQLDRVPKRTLKVDIPFALMGESQRLLTAGFRGGKDPWGQPWRPLKRPRTFGANRTRPLWGRGPLRRGFVARVERRGVRITTTVPYAAAHQFGVPGRNLPARPMLPLGRLSPVWAQAFYRRMRRIVRLALKKR